MTDFSNLREVKATSIRALNPKMDFSEVVCVPDEQFTQILLTTADRLLV